MSNDQAMSRRNMILAAGAGAASLAVLAALPSAAHASKWERLDKALVEMRECRKYLDNAPNIFGGHKKEAMKLLTAAIDEIQAAIKFAETNK